MSGATETRARGFRWLPLVYNAWTNRYVLSVGSVRAWTRRGAMKRARLAAATISPDLRIKDIRRV